MVEEHILRFQVLTDQAARVLDFPVQRVVCAGYSGRSQDAVQEHVRELVALGMPAPDSTPIFFQVSNYLATTGRVVTVQDRLTSGEVEFVLLFHEGEIFVTCGSDHTHRDLERHSIPGAKQMHPKILAPQVWRLPDVKSGWDRMVLRSWATLDGKEQLYQHAPLSHIMEAEQLLDAGEQRFPIRRNGTIFMSGTIPTVDGKLVYADRFAFEMHDPSLNRTLHHAYDVSVME